MSIYAVSVGLALVIALVGCEQGAAQRSRGTGPTAGSPAGSTFDARPAGIVPSGRFAVGTAAYEAINPRRPEPQTADPDDRRAVVFRAWYPAENPADLPTAPFFLGARKGELNAQLLSLPADAFASVPTHAVRDIPLVPGADRFPVVIFSPGKDTPAAFVFLPAGGILASHGYVVFAVSHPFGSGAVVFSDGRVATATGAVSDSQTRDQTILTWSADQRLVLATIEKLDAARSRDRMSGHLDLRRLALFGHSLGGAAAAQSCLEELRFRACANMDGSVGQEVLDSALIQPFLLLRAAGQENAESTLTPFFDSLRGIAYRAQLLGAGHNTFSDIGALLARLRLDGLTVNPTPLQLGTLPADRAYELVSRQPGGLLRHSPARRQLAHPAGPLRLPGSDAGAAPRPRLRQ